MIASRPIAAVPRVALTLEESARSLGVSVSHFRRHIAPELRVIRSGSVRLVPLAELQRWADRAATLAGASSLTPTDQVGPRRANGRAPAQEV